MMGRPATPFPLVAGRDLRQSLPSQKRGSSWSTTSEMK